MQSYNKVKYELVNVIEEHFVYIVFAISLDS